MSGPESAITLAYGPADVVELAAFRERTAELAKANADLKLEIAERRRVERNLARRAADLEQFAYSASHDLQEPIRNIVICAQLLARDCLPELDEKGRRMLDVVIGGAGEVAFFPPFTGG